MRILMGIVSDPISSLLLRYVFGAMPVGYCALRVLSIKALNMKWRFAIRKEVFNPMHGRWKMVNMHICFIRVVE